MVWILNNIETIIDRDDYEIFKKYKWYVLKNFNSGYITGYCRGLYGYKKSISLHRIIMKAKTNEVVDHINGNKYDNRKENLRMCTVQQNVCHNNKKHSNKSGYKGVSFSKDHKKWVARITVNYKTFHIGYFNSKEEAAIAYNEAAKKYHRQFANLNKIKEGVKI